ncbi:hypothetical protein F2Q70_00021935 [Brassica cretica]|uniref:Uncharacterized protein n=1 Tax=Brassica cretica TaxID=69181 RepID=A0A8S9GSK4_BRACR|nr:hypothetical protein F2Q70_00021935 [Brassica cretica]
MYVLEKYGDFGAFWGEELHRRVRCLAMDGDLTTHPVAEVMPILLKSGQSASREETVEEMKDYWGKEEEELEEEEKDQGRFLAIIDPPLLRWCQEIQSAQQMLLVKSPILNRIVRTDCGARQCTDQGWTSDPVAGRGPGQAQSAQESVLTSAWRSVPVRTSVVGSERLPSRPDGPCGTKRPDAILSEQSNETKAWGSGFPCGNYQGSSWGGYGSGSERFWAKKYKGTSGISLANPLEPIRPWEVTDKFDRGKQGVMDTRQREKEKEKEKDMVPGERMPKFSGVVRKPSDIAGDLMALNQGLGRFRNDVHGLGRTDHGRDLYDRD